MNFKGHSIENYEIKRHLCEYYIHLGAIQTVIKENERIMKLNHKLFYKKLKCCHEIWDTKSKLGLLKNHS